MTEFADAGLAPADTSEAAAAPRADRDEPTAAVVGGHFGEQLAGRRAALGLSQGDIAERLRLNPRQIAAIEAAELASLPALTFVRGYIRNYARVLGMDPEPLLADLRARAEPGVPQAASKPQRVAVPASPQATSEPYEATASGPVSRKAVIAIVIAALVLFAVVGLFASRKPATPATTNTATLPPNPAPAPGTAEVAGAVAGAPVTAPEPPAVVASPPIPAPKSADGKSTELKSAEPKSAAATGALLRLRFSERSWVEVTQGDGRLLVSQVNEAGSEQRFAGQPPYRLVIGNASTVTVEWRGRVVDLKPATNFDNVARITLD